MGPSAEVMGCGPASCHAGTSKTGPWLMNRFHEHFCCSVDSLKLLDVRAGGLPRSWGTAESPWAFGGAVSPCSSLGRWCWEVSYP